MGAAVGVRAGSGMTRSERPVKMLALLGDAYDARGGIAQFNRDLLGAIHRVWPHVAVHAVVRGACNPELRPQTVAGIAGASSRSGYVVTSGTAALRGGAPEVILCGHIHLAPLAAGLAHATGAALWVHLHGIEAWQPANSLVRRAVESADVVTAVSRYTRARALSWLGTDPLRCMVLANTVDARFTPGPRSPALAAAIGVAGRRVLLTVSRLAARERYKGHDRVIESLATMRARHPDVVYVVSGEGDDEDRLRALARDCDVAEHVRFVGRVADDQLADLYRLAELFVMPSTGEGFGIVYLEAMACGVRAIGLGSGGAVDALADGELGILAAEAELSDTMCRALSDTSHDRVDLSRRVHARFGIAQFDANVAAIGCLLPPRVREAA